ncbi:hypothetical protein O6H91_08G086700 [Diphasiastrum complanatum]|uniref:Uncharacterized protein n=1 Tax=Diphasiastrum complanatum TaxID=34168 RepID=A0ACC2CZL6_DIPCM|nr:hypothetical protein O6H91_Y044300 [Diphasiastrum complanatum]KAJ7547453.1 hypothetical protein O6H91_08G086700 [Diphasiastrum complanatum]
MIIVMIYCCNGRARCYPHMSIQFARFANYSLLFCDCNNCNDGKVRQYSIEYQTGPDARKKAAASILICPWNHIAVGNLNAAFCFCLYLSRSPLSMLFLGLPSFLRLSLNWVILQSTPIPETHSHSNLHKLVGTVTNLSA